MNPKHRHRLVEKHVVENRALDIQEIRLVSDLRIMHSKVDELFQTVKNMRDRHDESAIVKYADQPVLTEDIQNVDKIYLWFVRLKEEAISQRA